MQSLYKAMFVVHRNRSFSYNSFVKYHGNFFCSHNITMLYPNLWFNMVCCKGTALRLQTELKYPSKNRRRFTQRYNMTKIIFSKRTICALFNFAVEELKPVCKRSVEAQVYYTKKECFLRNIFTLAHKTLCCGHMSSCNKHYYHQSYILACSSIL